MQINAQTYLRAFRAVVLAYAIFLVHNPEPYWVCREPWHKLTKIPGPWAQVVFREGRL